MNINRFRFQFEILGREILTDILLFYFLVFNDNYDIYRVDRTEKE